MLLFRAWDGCCLTEIFCRIEIFNESILFSSGVVKHLLVGDVTYEESKGCFRVVCMGFIAEFIV